MPSSDSNRQIRVFISSTFRDMMRERDLLVKEVFPELRRKCAKRFVTFTEVDLRWGITEAQANEGRVLPLCLAEIERSRPYFIGFLGERYGWIPDTVRPEVIEQQLWLKEHVQGRTSVTELEILHGVLNNPNMQRHAFFYFRDPSYVNDPSLTENERWDLTEHDIRADVKKYGPDEASRRTEERKARLRVLKQRIRDSGLPLVEPYANPSVLAEKIRRTLNELIDRLYPEDQAPDPLVQERITHEAHAKNKLFACIDRPAHLAVLNDFAASSEHKGTGLVVTGESGSGKTTVLAAWARDWAKMHPDDFLFQHYFGATPESASPEGFLRRLLSELKTRFSIGEDIPNDPEKCRDILPVWLAQTIGKERLVLVLDGLNQVLGGEPARRLRFLPRHFPPNVVAVASTLAGPTLDSLRERCWGEYKLPSASEAEVDAMVGAYLTFHARTLEPALRHRLVTASATKSPLFLRTVLEELRQFGSFEELPERVRHYLEADNPKDLFRRVLKRWQEDFDGNDSIQDRPNLDLVRRALTHLWAARQGLSESEWLDLLGDGLQPLPHAWWSPLFLALEPHVGQRAGLFGYGHDFLRQAVEEAFVPTADLQQAAHLSVAEYFERHPHQREMTPRKAAEWPHQLRGAQAWERLERCLTDLPLFLTLFDYETQWELTGYWHSLRSLGRDMAESYAAAYASWIAVPGLGDDHIAAERLGLFLSENGLYAAAEPMFKRALSVRERVLGSEHPATLESINYLGMLLEKKGDFMAAEPPCRRALEATERILGPEHFQTVTVINNLANVLFAKSNYDEAEALHRRALLIQERTLGPENRLTLRSLDNLAGVLRVKGDLVSAEALTRRALEAFERTLGPEHPDTLTALNNLSFIMHKKGDDAAAKALLRRALQSLDRVMGPEHPNTLSTLNGFAMILASQGDVIEAEPLFRRMLRGILRAIGAKGDRKNLDFSLRVYAGVLRKMGRSETEVSAQINSLCRPFGLQVGAPAHETAPDKFNVERCVACHSQAQEAFKRGDYIGAKALLEESQDLCVKLKGPENLDVAMLYCEMAVVENALKNAAVAESYLRRALEIREKGLGATHLETLSIVSGLVIAAANRNDHETAEALQRRLCDGSRQELGENHPEALACQVDLAGLLARREKLEESKALYDSVLETARLTLGAKHEVTVRVQKNLEALGTKILSKLREESGATPASCDAAAQHFEETGQLEMALFGRRECVAAEIKAYGSNHPNVALALNQLAILLRKLGRPAEAESVLRRAIEIEKNALPPDSPKHPHRLNNLATVLVMQGKTVEAAALLERAWRLKAGRHDITSARILIVSFLADLLDNKSTALPLGQLKSLLARPTLEAIGGVVAKIEIKDVLAYLKPRLSSEAIELLSGVVDAFNDRANLSELESFAAWRAAAPQPLE